MSSSHMSSSPSLLSPVAEEDVGLADIDAEDAFARESVSSVDTQSQHSADDGNAAGCCESVAEDTNVDAATLVLLTSVVKALAVCCCVLSTAFTVHAAASPLSSEAWSAVDVLVHLAGLVLADAVVSAAVLAGALAGLLQAVASHDTTCEVLKASLMALYVDGLVMTLLSIMCCGLVALMGGWMHIDMLTWTLLDGLLQSNVSVFFRVQSLNPAMWVAFCLPHILTFAMLCVYACARRSITPATLPDGTAPYLGICAIGLLVVTHVALCGALTSPHIFDILFKSSLLRILQAFAGGLLAWNVFLRWDVVRMLAILAWRTRHAAWGVLGIAWAEQLGQPLQGGSTAACAHVLLAQACMSHGQAWFPRFGFVLWIGFGVCLRRYRITRREPDTETSVLRASEEQRVEWRAMCRLMSASVASVFLSWPIANALMMLLYITGLSGTLGSNVVVVPCLLVVCGAGSWFYASRVRTLCQRFLEHYTAVVYGVVLFVAQKLRCSS